MNMKLRTKHFELAVNTLALQNWVYPVTVASTSRLTEILKTIVKTTDAIFTYVGSMNLNGSSETEQVYLHRTWEIPIEDYHCPSTVPMRFTVERDVTGNVRFKIYLDNSVLVSEAFHTGDYNKSLNDTQPYASCKSRRIVEFVS